MTTLINASAAAALEACAAGMPAVMSAAPSSMAARRAFGNAPAARDQMAAEPAAGERTGGGHHIRRPGEHADLPQAESAHVVEIERGAR